MPLSRAQVEDFVRAFFADHRLAAPRIRFCARPPRVTLAARKTLSLPRYASRAELAEYVAARLCREVIRRDSKFRREIEQRRAKVPGKGSFCGKHVLRPRLSAHFEKWQTYVRGVVNAHFGDL